MIKDKRKMGMQREGTIAGRGGVGWQGRSGREGSGGWGEYRVGGS